MYLLSAIDYYLILYFFPQGKRNNLCGVSVLLCDQGRKSCGVVGLKRLFIFEPEFICFHFISQLHPRKIYFEVKCSENCQVDDPSDQFCCSPAEQLQ